MSDLFTIKVVTKDGDDLHTTLYQAKNPNYAQGPLGGYRLSFLEANSTDDVRKVFIIGDYSSIEGQRDQDAFSNVHSAVKAYIENGKGATVAALHARSGPKAAGDPN